MKVAIFALILCVGVASGLQCFSCNSAIDSSCGDHFSEDSPALVSAFVETCDPKQEEIAFCRKVKMYLDLTSEVRVQRDCAYMRREDRVCYQQRADDHIMDTCQCDGDLCNTAVSHSSATFTMIAAVFVSLVAGVAAH